MCSHLDPGGWGGRGTADAHVVDRCAPGTTEPDEELIPRTKQDRTLWDQTEISEGIALITAALSKESIGLQTSNYRRGALIIASERRLAIMYDIVNISFMPQSR